MKKWTMNSFQCKSASYARQCNGVAITSDDERSPTGGWREGDRTSFWMAAQGYFRKSDEAR